MMTCSGGIIAITSMSLKHAYGIFTTQKYNNSITSSLKFFSLRENIISAFCEKRETTSLSKSSIKMFYTSGIW